MLPYLPIQPKSDKIKQFQKICQKLYKKPLETQLENFQGFQKVSTYFYDK